MIALGFDLLNIKYKEEDYSESVSGTGLNFTAGYAAFISDRFAIEPALTYRLGLSDENDGTKANGFGVQVGLGFYF